MEIMKQDNESLREELEDTIEEYEKKVQEERKSAARENIENLQTLIKELSSIEECNERLTEQLQEERKENEKLRSQIELQNEVISELEKKVERGASTERGERFFDTKKQERLTELVLQLYAIVGSPDLSVQLEKEKESHKKTRDTLEQQIDDMKNKIKILETHKLLNISMENHVIQTTSTKRPEDNADEFFKAVDDANYDLVHKLLKKNKNLVNRLFAFFCDS